MRNRQPNSDSLAGSLLLAHPAMQDPNFHRAVVLLSAHDDEGALGVVLNRPMDQELSDLDESFGISNLGAVPVYEGGPVQTDRLLICGVSMHSGGEGLRLHFGIEPAAAKDLLAEHGEMIELRAFLGHSGWSAGQLENELEQNTWAVSEIPGDLLQRDPDESLWRGVISMVSPEWRLLAEEPDEPERN
ncbi:MAG: YqgE/AlgH family protein [Verrucomicrobiia bacterium]